MDKRGEKKQYSDSFKRMIARESLTGDMTVIEIAKKYDLPHYNTVTIWRRQFKDKLDDVGDLQIKPYSTPQEKKDIDVINKKAKELEKALANANLKIVALETMIDIAEDVLKINIRKKSGTKQ
jgi:transposase